MVTVDPDRWCRRSGADDLYLNERIECVAVGAVGVVRVGVAQWAVGVCLVLVLGSVDATDGWMTNGWMDEWMNDG